MGLEKMSLEASQASQASPGGIGSRRNWVPKMVLFEVKCT
jgi:hypothetical protein